MSTLNQKVAAFLKSHKNQSAAAMALLGITMEHALSSRDWTPLARLVQGVEPRMHRRMLQIVGRCMGGVTGAVDTKAEFGYRFKLGDNAAFTDQKPEFDILVVQKEGIYGGAVEKFLGLGVKAPVEFDPAKRAEALALKAVAAGTDLELLLELVKRAYIKANAAKVPVAAEVVGEPAH